jgi:hypothetical protein
VKDWIKELCPEIAEWQADQIAEQADKLYEAGWNSALEMAAFRLQHDFKRSFGEDTLASIAVYIKEMKK